MLTILTLNDHGTRFEELPCRNPCLSLIGADDYGHLRQLQYFALHVPDTDPLSRMVGPAQIVKRHHVFYRVCGADAERQGDAGEKRRRREKDDVEEQGI